MAENRTPHPPDLEPPELHHETADVNVWAVGKFGIALAILAICSMGGVFALFRFLERAEGGPLPAVGRSFEIDARKRPPAPLLEETPILDLALERAAEDKLLNSYGWVEHAAGTVRIPVERAIDLLAQRGLPTEPRPPAGNVTVPTTSGMGEIMQQPGGPLGGSK
jgi:hypothetical protein